MIFLCRWFQWDEIKTEEVHKQGLKLSEKVLTHLEDAGQQLALTFNNDGSMLAVGGEVETILDFFFSLFQFKCSLVNNSNLNLVIMK